MTGMNGICVSRGTIGEYKDARRDMNACMHADESWRILVVFVMFVNSFEFVSQDMIHTCVVRYTDTD